MSGKDLGTCMILLAIGAVALILGDFPGKWLALIGASGVLLVGGLVLSSPNRMGRILATYQTCSASDLQGVCYQAVHATMPSISGLLGVGIGNPERNGVICPRHNDFIFAIIGEETGFIRASMVILLFVVLGLVHACGGTAGTEPVRDDGAAPITVCGSGQAIVNIGVVIGSRHGRALTFCPAGGSSLIMWSGCRGHCRGMMKEQPQIKAEICQEA